LEFVGKQLLERKTNAKLLWCSEKEYQKSSFEPGACITSLSSVICSPYLPGDQAPTISSQVVGAPSNMSILRMSHPHLLDHERWDNTALQDADDSITDILCAWFYNIKTESRNFIAQTLMDTSLTISGWS
jgi:hypothetical protein